MSEFKLYRFAVLDLLPGAALAKLAVAADWVAGALEDALAEFWLDDVGPGAAALAVAVWLEGGAE